MDLEWLSRFLLWSLVINVGVLLLYMIVFVGWRGFVYRVHGKLFGLSDTTLNTIHYSLMAVYKTTIIFFNLVPYIALRLTL